MRLQARDLGRHLAGDLAPAYLVSGDEPLLVAEAAREIRDRARREGFEEREYHVVERGFPWRELEAGAENLSLFSQRRIIELRLPSPRPGDLGARTLRTLLERRDPDRLLLIVTTKLDAGAAKSVWVKSVEAHGALVQVWPVERPELAAWIRRRAAARGLALTVSAAELLADRVEGNLLAADQEVQKLALLLGEGSADEASVLDAVAANPRFDVFRLTDAVLAGQAVRAFRILDGLRNEGVEPALISWAISRDVCLLARLRAAERGGEQIGRSLARLRVWRRRQPLVTQALARFEQGRLTRLVAQSAEVDNIIKGVLRGSPWEELTRLVMVMLEPLPARSRSRSG